MPWRPCSTRPSHDDPAPDAGADDQADHDAAPAGGAERRLGQREAIRVVRETHVSTPNADDRSVASGRPFRHTVFEFLSVPVSRLDRAGVPNADHRRAPEADVRLEPLARRDRRDAMMCS